MRVKTKIYIFIGAIFAVLLIGLFAGWNFTAIGSSIVGLGGAIWAALRGRRIPGPSDATDAADNAGNDARTEASGNAESMDSLVRDGQNLLDASEELIRETGRGEGSANTKPRR